jgi:diacylglycerol kinase (ATP)
MVQQTQMETQRPIKVERSDRIGLIRIWRALGWSLAGVAAAYKAEAAFRQEVALTAILIPIAIVLPVSGPGTALMVAVVLLVLIVELLNSAIESAVDRISVEHHPLAKQAKDIGSAAVFIALVNVVVVWLLVLFG